MRFFGLRLLLLVDYLKPRLKHTTKGHQPTRKAPKRRRTRRAEETIEDDAETPFIEVEEDEDMSDIIGGDVEDDDET